MPRSHRNVVRMAYLVEPMVQRPSGRERSNDRSIDMTTPENDESRFDPATIGIEPEQQLVVR